MDRQWCQPDLHLGNIPFKTQDIFEEDLYLLKHFQKIFFSENIQILGSTAHLEEQRSSVNLFLFVTFSVRQGDFS